MMDFLFPDQYESSDIVELHSVCSSSIFFVLPHHFFSLFLIYVSPKGIIFRYYFSLESYFWDLHFHYSNERNMTEVVCIFPTGKDIIIQILYIYTTV